MLFVEYEMVWLKKNGVPRLESLRKMFKDPIFLLDNSSSWYNKMVSSTFPYVSQCQGTSFQYELILSENVGFIRNFFSLGSVICSDMTMHHKHLFLKLLSFTLKRKSRSQVPTFSSENRKTGKTFAFNLHSSPYVASYRKNLSCH